MKENSIEETIKQLKLMLKVRKEQKDIIECAGGSCINCDPDIKALTESINILSDYKRVLKENKELKLYNNSITSELEQMTTEKFKDGWFHQSEFKGLIPVQKVKDKIEEIQKEYNKLDKQIDEYINDVNKDLAKYYENKEKISIMQTLSCFIDTLQELLEGRK